MKANVIAAFIISVFLLTVYACKKEKNTDACSTVSCQNGGSCQSGTCNCPSNYTGTNCEIEVREQYLGSYNAVTDCNSSYTVTITKSNLGVGYVNLYNIDSQGSTVFATFNGLSLNIPSQTVGNFIFNGNITYQGGFVTATFDYDRSSVYCFGTMTKQ
ncbi:MAG: calcium-binding EGF-like domain-containing protein [Chitinophagales bacterium]